MKFRVLYEVDGGGWHASIPDVRGCRTWGRSLSEARRNVREALATCEDVFKDAEATARDAVFVDEIRLPTVARRALDESESARAELASSEENARTTRARAARELAGAGCSLRDVGELLGISQEMVRRILEKGARRARRAS